MLASLSVGFAKSPILNVGVIADAEPIAYVNHAGQYDGVAVMLWKEIAKELNYQYRFIPIKTTYNQAIHDLAKKKYDVLVGAISVIHDRVKLVDYSRPFFLNQIGIAVHQQHLTFLDTLQLSFGRTVLIIFILFIVFLLIFSHLFWYFEKDSCRQVSKTYRRGIGEAIWTTVSSFLRDVLYDPKNTSARVVLGFWLLLSVIFISVVTAIITATLTYNLQAERQYFKNAVDLNNKLVGVQQGTSSENLLMKFGAKIKSYPREISALEALNQGEVEGVVGDYFILKRLIKKNSNLKLRMSSLKLIYDEYAFPVPYGSPYLKAINLEITRLQDYDFSNAICRRYLAEDAQNCKL